MLLPGQWATIPAAPTNTTTCADSTKTHSSAGTTNAGNTSCGRTGQQDVNNNEAKIDIMIGSGAATHVCPPWFAPNSPMYTLQHGQGPQLRTTTDKTIPVYGRKRVLMTNINKQQLVVPFFVCEVTQPIMSVTRLAEQGFNIQLNETPTVALVQRDGLYFMTMEFVNIPVNMQLEVHQTTQGTTAQITPVTLTPPGMEVLRNRNGLWTFNS